MHMQWLLPLFTGLGAISGAGIGYCGCMLHRRYYTEAQDENFDRFLDAHDRVNRVMRDARDQMDDAARRHQMRQKTDLVGHWSQW